MEWRIELKIEPENNSSQSKYTLCDGGNTLFNLNNRLQLTRTTLGFIWISVELSTTSGDQHVDIFTNHVVVHIHVIRQGQLEPHKVYILKSSIEYVSKC